MNDLLARLFNLDTLRFGDEGVSLSLAHPLPAWAWLLIAAGAGALAVWSYSRLVGPRWARYALATLRALVVLLLALLAAGPELVRPNERVEPDRVLALVDRSASLSVRDAGDAASPVTRQEQLQSILESSWPVWSRLASTREVNWLGFDAGAFDLPGVSSDAAPKLTAPEGRRTSIPTAIEQALRRAAGRPVSAIVLFTDGRSADELDSAASARALLARLQADRIPVFAVPLGSARALPDVAVDRVDAPPVAFVKDAAGVNVFLSWQNTPDDADAPGVTIELVEAATQLVLDRRTVTPGTEEVSLSARPEQAGRVEWQVRVVPQGPDLVAGNNAQTVTVELVDRPMRVLYLDGYPRWEYRFLKNLLVRERTIESSILLLASDRRYIQDGSVLLETMPRSAEEWARFDVVMLGDLPGELFSAEQLQNLREVIASRGTGLMWIAGPNATPVSWRGTPLADLIPFSASPEEARSGGGIQFAEPVTMSRTSLAERLGLLAMTDGGEDGSGDTWLSRLSDPSTGWSRLQYAQRIARDTLKPAVEVLATARPISLASAPGDEHDYPLVVSMRYGSGRVVYVATDEIWRWRYARGEDLPERFWLPLVRAQGREALARGGAGALLTVTPPRAVVSQPVRIAVQVLDQAIVQTPPQGVSVRIRRDIAEPTEGPIALRLSPETTADQDAAAGLTYAATWVPSEAGSFVVEVDEPALTSSGEESRLRAAVAVTLPDDELRRPQADHDLLARLAEATGGSVLSPASLQDLPRLVPNRELRIAGTPDVQTLWDSPLALILLISLLTLEWIGRKLLHLS